MELTAQMKQFSEQADMIPYAVVDSLEFRV